MKKSRAASGRGERAGKKGKDTTQGKIEFTDMPNSKTINFTACVDSAGRLSATNRETSSRFGWTRKSLVVSDALDS